MASPPVARRDVDLLAGARGTIRRMSRILFGIFSIGSYGLDLLGMIELFLDKPKIRFFFSFKFTQKYSFGISKGLPLPQIHSNLLILGVALWAGSGI